MQNFIVHPIGRFSISNGEIFVKIEPQYISALKELDGFSHLNLFWWFDGCDNEYSRNILEVQGPYKKAPEIMGTFATRSPERPNPIAMTVAQIIHIDHESGKIKINYTDAIDNSPVLDLKPYTPSLDRIENPEVPDWCSHWPHSLEESADFDWSNEFNF